VKASEMRKTWEIPQTWGGRLVFMRGRRSAHEVVQAINALNIFDIRVNNNDFTKLETSEELPDGPRSGRIRAIAYVACLVYGYDPRLLGLSLEVLPPRLRELGYEKVCELAGNALPWIDIFAGHSLESVH
jgi:hypothetical protein